MRTDHYDHGTNQIGKPFLSNEGDLVPLGHLDAEGWQSGFTRAALRWRQG